MVDQTEALRLYKQEAEDMKLAPLEMMMMPVRLDGKGVPVGYLYIKTKDGRLLPLELNRVQRYLLDKVLDYRARKKPIRFWILKSRQEGVSTCVEAIIYCLTSQQPNRNALIMADEIPKSNHLFEMFKLYQEQLGLHQPHLSPKLKKSNEKKLEFAELHSQILIDTSQNLEVGKAFTLQYVHASECAIFPKLGVILDGLLQAVPNHWDTIVIGETTANGMDNEFYTEWQKAKKGETDWLPIFFPWFWMETYTFALINGQLIPADGIQQDTEGGMEDFLAEEELLQRQYNLTNEQMNWRRWCIKNNCRGLVRTFRESYPSTDEEAFLTSGSCVFDTVKLKEQLAAAQIKAEGELYQDITGKVVFRTRRGGPFRQFEGIGPTSQIVIGADTAEGIGKDYSCAVALDVRTNNTVMTYMGQSDPDVFAQDLNLMGRFLNKALIAPESNSIGSSTCLFLSKVYPREFILKETIANKERLGWWTDNRKRRNMIVDLIQEIRQRSTELRDPDLIHQCLTFVQEKGVMGAAAGEHDDFVFARMIAGQLRDKYPYTARHDGAVTEEDEEDKAAQRQWEEYAKT